MDRILHVVTHHHVTSVVFFIILPAGYVPKYNFDMHKRNWDLKHSQAGLCRWQCADDKHKDQFQICNQENFQSVSANIQRTC